MSNTNQYFFSIDKLEKLLRDFKSRKVDLIKGPVELKGFVFTPGSEEVSKGNYKDCIYPFPVYASTKEKGINGDGRLIMQNTDPKYIGCPYPPPCDTKSLQADCYGNSK